MKGFLNNFYICPKDRLEYYFNKILEIKELRKKSNSQKIFSPKVRRNLISKNNEKNEFNQNYYRTMDKLRSFNNKKKIFNSNTPKNIHKKINNSQNSNLNQNHFRAYTSGNELCLKDIKVLKQFKKYKDFFKQNEENYDIAKNVFIDDYKKNIFALNNYLTINYNGTHDDIVDLNNQNLNLNKKINYFIKNKKRININNHIQLDSNFKENKFFFDKLNNNKKKKSNNFNKTFKETFKMNSRLEIERIRFKKKNTNNINTKKNRKMIEYNFLSTAGKKNGKISINQDNYLIMDNLWNCENIKIFGVFDGHGNYGELLTQEIKDMFKYYFSKNDNLDEKNVDNVYRYISNNNFQIIYEIFQNINDKINKKYISNDFCIQCGTTTSILFLFYKKNIINKIISINLGDTKSILINDNNIIKQLNICHTPNITEERIRIENNGGEVGRLEWTNGGPLRIWFKGKKNYALSITRSLGDFDAENLGVISKPDISQYDIDEEKIKIIVIATEGLWAFLKNEKVMDIVLSYYVNNDVKGATKKLTEIATKLWEFRNPNEINDITIIVLFFK